MSLIIGTERESEILYDSLRNICHNAVALKKSVRAGNVDPGPLSPPQGGSTLAEVLCLCSHYCTAGMPHSFKQIP